MVSQGTRRIASHRVGHSNSTYAAMIAKKLRELRDSRRWSIDDFRQKLAEHGITRANGDLIPQTTAYSYEQGPDNNGACLPWELIPVIAAVYGYKTPHGWLPEEFPG